MTLPDTTHGAPASAKAFPRWLLWAWLALLVAAPLVLWALPADYFDEGESMCPSVQLFDTECPGCGSTRAVQHLHHAELGDALYFHSLAPLIYGVLVVLWALWTYRTAARLGLLGARRAEAVEAKLRAEAERRIARRERAFGKGE